MGDKQGALAITRQQELDAMDESLRPLQRTIYALKDMADAATVAAQAAEKFAGYRDDLLKTRDAHRRGRFVSGWLSRCSDRADALAGYARLD